MVAGVGINSWPDTLLVGLIEAEMVQRMGNSENKTTTAAMRYLKNSVMRKRVFLFCRELAAVPAAVRPVVSTDVDMRCLPPPKCPCAGIGAGSHRSSTAR